MGTTWENADPYIDFWESILNTSEIENTKYKIQSICTEIEDAEYEMIE